MSEVTHVNTTELAGEIGSVVHDLPVIIKETKSGWKTTEFWASVVTVLVPLLDGVPEKFMIPLAGVVAAAYTISRGLAKKGVPAEVVPVTPPVDRPTT